MRKQKGFRPAVNDVLEDRTVPSGFFGYGTNSVLAQDARALRQDFQALQSSFQSAVAGLAATATSSAAPSDFTAFNSAVQDAINTLDTAVANDLKNLTNTGPGLVSQIQNTLNTTLLNELESAGKGLANSLPRSVFSVDRLGARYIQSALQQATQLVLNDTASTAVSPTTIRTVNRSVNTALQTFNNALITAVQNVLTGKATTLDVSAAGTQLTTDLTNAVSSLPSGAQPTTLAADVTTLTTDLSKIALPTTTNRFSTRVFLFQVLRTVIRDEGTILRDVNTAIQTYNTSQL